MSCWGTINLQDKGRKLCLLWASDFSLKLIHSLAGNPPNNAVDLCHPCPHCTAKGSTVSEGRHRRCFPIHLPSFPHHMSSTEVEPRWHGGVGSWYLWHCGQQAGCSQPALAKVRAEKLVLVLFQLLATSFPPEVTASEALPGGVTCSACPQHMRVHPSSQPKCQSILQQCWLRGTRLQPYFIA